MHDDLVGDLVDHPPPQARQTVAAGGRWVWTERKDLLAGVGHGDGDLVTVEEAHQEATRGVLLVVEHIGGALGVVEYMPDELGGDQHRVLETGPMCSEGVAVLRAQQRVESELHLSARLCRRGRPAYVTGRAGFDSRHGAPTWLSASRRSGSRGA
ncbi:hypothetical protein [Streptomyces sp. NPDC059513]|uniref:hypothetical protein n=1 Tax=unclassified Streptomyces TaxID=2593676 RepID=UPI003692A3B9